MLVLLMAVKFLLEDRVRHGDANSAAVASRHLADLEAFTCQNDGPQPAAGADPSLLANIFPDDQPQLAFHPEAFVLADTTKLDDDAQPATKGRGRKVVAAIGPQPPPDPWEGGEPPSTP